MRNLIIPYTNEARLFARELRNKQTYTEKVIWELIRKKKLGVEFHRQVPMLSFVVDFYCHEIMLAIEIDGGYHLQVNQQIYDAKRQELLEEKGVNFIRINSEQVLSDKHGVIATLVEKIANLREIYG